MKIIKVDNYDKETVSDILIAENVNSCYGEDIVKFLNIKYSRNNSSDFFRLVKDDYKLYEWKP